MVDAVVLAGSSGNVDPAGGPRRGSLGETSQAAKRQGGYQGNEDVTFLHGRTAIIIAAGIRTE
jgi:hypothetical protein